MPETSEPRPLTGIAALAKNRVIGKDNALPWRLPEDFKHFKNTTLGGVLIMGRKTFESIGRPLPGRDTIVLSRSGAEIPGATVVRDIAGARKLFPGKKLFLAGGAQLYADLLAECDELILTHVHAEPAGDAFFPEYENLFDAGEILTSTPEFTIRRHRRRSA